MDMWAGVLGFLSARWMQHRVSIRIRFGRLGWKLETRGDGRLGGRGPKGSCEAVWWQAVVMKLILDPFYTKTLP